MLVVVVDIAPYYAGLRSAQRTQLDQKNIGKNSKGPGTIEGDVILSVCEFVTAYTIMEADFEWIVIGTTPSRNRVLGRSTDEIGRTGVSPTVNIKLGVQALIQESLQDLTSAKTRGEPNPTLSGGVTPGVASALCIINKKLNSDIFKRRQRGRVQGDASLSAIANSGSKDAVDIMMNTSAGGKTAVGGGGGGTSSFLDSPRILVIQTSPDNTKDYNAMMNCAFAAVRDSIVIDGLYLPNATTSSSNSSDQDSLLLHQLTDLTSGVYMPPPRAPAQVSGGITQILMTVYLGGGAGDLGAGEAPSGTTSSSASNQVLSRVVSERVDFRGRCFKTGKVVDVGYVCNLCLSVFGKDVYDSVDAGDGKLICCFTCGAQIEGTED